MSFMKFKGFLFTLDAVFALIIAGVAISILIYFNFIPLTTYQFSSSEVYNLMQNLIGTQISNISQSSLIGNYSTATYYAKSDQWPYFGANSNLTSNSSYGPQMLDLLFTYKTPGNIISSPVANNGKIAFETSNQIFVLNSSTGSNYLNITTNSIINGNASVLLYKDSLIYMTSNTIDSINLINKQGSVINQNLVLNSFIVASVPITLTNSQTSQTPAPFQQMIVIDPASYKAYEAGNLQNIEFFYANGTIISSWLETGNSNTSTQAIYWLKLNNGIPAQTSITIYMGIGSISTNFFNGNTIGEAPQLSSTYAEYDNGANIFDYYNLNPTSLSGWTVNSISSGAGLSTTAPENPYFETSNAFVANSVNGDYLYTQIPSLGKNIVISYWIYTSALGDVFFDVNSAGSGQMSRLGCNPGWYGLASTSSWTSWTGPPDTGPTCNIWYEVSININQSSAITYYDPCTNAQTACPSDGAGDIAVNPSNIYSISNNGNYLGLIGDGAGSGSFSYWNGIIIRNYPPSGVMPTQTTGPIIQLPTNNAAPIADAPISIEDGYIAEGTLSGFYLLNLSNFGIYTSILTSIFGIPNIMTPAYADGEFIISSSSRFKNYIMSYSLNGKVLSQNWNYSLTSSPTTSPFIYNNTIYVGSGDNLYAFTLGGNLIFNVLLGSQIKGISISNNEIFVQCQNSIYGLNAKTGIILFSYSTKPSYSTAISAIVPSSTPNILYSIVNNTEFQAYNLQTNSMIWNITLPTSSYKNFSNIALAYGSAYITDGNALYSFRTCEENPKNNLLKTIAGMYLNYSGACADIFFSKAYNSSNAGIFINNTYGPSMHVASFNGKNSLINASNSIALDPANSITLLAWVYPVKYASNNRNGGGIISKGPQYEISVNASGYAVIDGHLAIAPLYSNVKVPLNTWSFIAGELNANGTAEICVNAACNSKTGTSESSLLITSNPLCIGFGTIVPGTPGTYFNGSIADAQIYNISLSQYQISYFYQKGIAGIPLSNNIAAWYPLQGNANDYSGNNNIGFSINVTYPKSNYIPNSYKNAYQINRLSMPLNLNVNNTSKLYNVSVAIWH